MKNTIYSLAIVIILMSCAQTTDKNAQLEKLKAQREKIDSQIAKLEEEIDPSDSANTEKAVPVRIELIKPCIFNHYVEVQGVVDGDQNVAVSPQTAGIVTAVYVKEGSAVKKGQVLAELDAQVLKQTLEEVKTQLDLANNLYEKQKALWDKKIGSEVQFLQAKTNKESMEKRVKTLNDQIDLAKIISPINGTVESVPLKVGQMASPGVPASSIRVINMSNAKITADVSENYAARIHHGDDAIVRFPDLGKEFDTKLNFTSRFIDPTNRTFKVECRITERDVELRANMIAYVRIKDYVNDMAFCLPVNLVQNSQDGKFVYVAVEKNNQWIASRQMIKPGLDYNGVIEILDGVTEGDKIVSAGYQNLKEGEPVVFN